MNVKMTDQFNVIDIREGQRDHIRIPCPELRESKNKLFFVFFNVLDIRTSQAEIIFLKIVPDIFGGVRQISKFQITS